MLVGGRGMTWNTEEARARRVEDGVGVGGLEQEDALGRACGW